MAPVNERQEGYRRLAAYLPAVEVDADGSSDLYYQINRPRVTRRLGFNLTVNRLCKWSVPTFQRILVPLGGGGEPRASRGDPERPACRLEFDINTDREFAEQLQPDQMGALLADFASYATEISQEGDRP